MDGYYSGDIPAEYEEIGGRCDKVYACDICGMDEILCDECGEHVGFLSIYRVDRQDICEWCLRVILGRQKGNPVGWQKQGF